MSCTCPMWPKCGCDARESAREMAPTFRPPADQRCPTCDRILLSVPCGCETPAAQWARIDREQADRWRAMSRPDRIEALRLRVAGRV